MTRVELDHTFCWRRPLVTLALLMLAPVAFIVVTHSG